MAKAKATKAKPKGNALIKYLRDTRSELRKVHWPTRQEAWGLTKIVLTVTVSMALFLGFMDYLFALELRGVIERNAIAIGVAMITGVASIVVAMILNRRTA